MENNSLENPWNLKLNCYDESPFEKKCKVLLKRGIIGRFSCFKNMPNLFYKFDNLVLCNICHILVCKKSCFKHAKLHEKETKCGDSANTISSASEGSGVLRESDVYFERCKKQNNKVSHLKLEATVKEKRRKVAEEKVVISTDDAKVHFNGDKEPDSSRNNFVPKSTLNAANPLRIRIQLQPKIETEHRNGNIFENMNNFCKNINNNLSQNSIVNGNTENDSDHFTKMKEHNHATTNRIITIQKYHPMPQQSSNSLRSVPTNSRPRGNAIINHSMPEYLKLPNQTSSLPSQIRTDNHQSSQQPQVFQTFRQGSFPGKSSHKKYVEVKTLQESLVPVSSTQSLNSINNLDQNQLSFQKILIENGMFSEEDIKRAQKSNSDRLSINDINNHMGRIRRSYNVPTRPSNNYSINPGPRFVNKYMIRPSSERPSSVTASKSDLFISSQQTSSTIRHQNVQFYRSMDLSDDEFYLDQTLVDNNHVQLAQPSTSLPNLVSRHSQSTPARFRTSLSQSSSISKNLDQQTTATVVRCPNDYNTADVHYLPPPEQTITSLSWEQ